MPVRFQAELKMPVWIPMTDDQNDPNDPKVVPDGKVQVTGWDC